MKTFIFCVLGCLLIGCGKKSEKPVSYQADIQPMLNTHCIQCHGSEKAYRKIVLTSYDSVMNSKLRTQKKPIVIAKKVADSWLYILAATKQVHYRMPPDTTTVIPFTDDEVKLLARWIEQGALNN
jgi:uncharacterized membrane protein